MENTAAIKLEEYISKPPEKVWKALTDPVILAKWWAPGDIKPVAGHKYLLDMGPQFGKQPCEILKVENEKMISYTFSPEILNSTITWNIEPEGEGTRLFLEHSGFDMDSQMGKIAFNGMKSGWPNILKKIDQIIE